MFSPVRVALYSECEPSLLQKDPRATLSLSEAQSDYCKTHDFDPENPQCARVLLTGTMQEVRHKATASQLWLEWRLLYKTCILCMLKVVIV